MSTVDSISDNDTSEKPVREKLKKTSLASMSGPIVERQDKTFRADEESSGPDRLPRNSSLQKEINMKSVEPRGRPVRKRSFDDLDTPETESADIGNNFVAKPYLNTHLRKRSRDVRVGEGPKENARPLLTGTTVREESEDAADRLDTSQTCTNSPKSAVDNDTPVTESLPEVKMQQDSQPQEMGGHPRLLSESVQGDHVKKSEKDSPDQEMRDSAFSPQKKRSRDQFDTEADREQKIPATEEARAHRRSDELERGEVHAMSNQSPVFPEGFEVVEKDLVRVEAGNGLVPRVDEMRRAQPVKSAFGSTSAFSSMAFARSDTSADFSTFGANTTDQESQTSADAFASSGFAALAGSSTSPFGTLGGSSTAVTGSPFAAAGVLNLGKAEADKKGAHDPKAAMSGGFGTFVNSLSAGLGTTEKSPFDTSASNKTSVFGSSVFGSAFGRPLSGGSRLTSFAAPLGNAKLGVSNGAIKPIGPPKRDEDEYQNSESEGEELVENRGDEETDEADGRFQHQDVETGEGGEDSIFSSRASLYSFRDNAWKESGKGIFKLNIAPVSSEDDSSSSRKTGRFIMRAHQTYRVLLNVPVFKQMQIGDSKGDEPSGKSFLFAVIENAKPVAHMLKLADVTDSRTLYHEVRKLQEGLE